MATQTATRQEAPAIIHFVEVTENVWAVTPSTATCAPYVARCDNYLVQWSCTCADFNYRKNPVKGHCKHIVAIRAECGPRCACGNPIAESWKMCLQCLHAPHCTYCGTERVAQDGLTCEGCARLYGRPAVAVADSTDAEVVESAAIYAEALETCISETATPSERNEAARASHAFAGAGTALASAFTW